MTPSAALHRSPAISTVASPKSNWAWPGGCESGTKASFEYALGPLHRRLHLGVAARVAVLVAQALEDPPGRVALLGRGLFVVGQDLVDDGQMGPEHGLSAGLGHLIAGRFGVGQDLGQGLMPDPVVTVDGALRRPFHQDLPPDLGPFVHVGVHLSPVLLVRSGPKALKRDRTDPGILRCCRFRPCFYTLRCCRFRS